MCCGRNRSAPRCAHVRPLEAASVLARERGVPGAPDRRAPLRRALEAGRSAGAGRSPVRRREDKWFYCLNTENSDRAGASASVASRPVFPPSTRNASTTSRSTTYSGSPDRNNGVMKWKQALSVRPSGGPIVIGRIVVVAGVAFRDFSAASGRAGRQRRVARRSGGAAADPSWRDGRAVDRHVHAKRNFGSSNDNWSRGNSVYIPSAPKRSADGASSPPPLATSAVSLHFASDGAGQTAHALDNLIVGRLRRAKAQRIGATTVDEEEGFCLRRSSRVPRSPASAVDRHRGREAMYSRKKPPLGGAHPVLTPRAPGRGPCASPCAWLDSGFATVRRVGRSPAAIARWTSR